MVTRRLGRVEGVTVNLQMVGFPGEDLFDREELGRKGSLSSKSPTMSS